MRISIPARFFVQIHTPYTVPPENIVSRIRAWLSKRRINLCR